MDFILSIVALVIVITIHEFSHAWTANFFGDPTAKLAGRVSLNPLKHLDPMGTIMMFLIRMGWGKPVPVNPYYFKKPKRDEALTALAGPLSNLILAIVIAVPYKYWGYSMVPVIRDFLGILLDVSLLLFLFNMLPFPPLDGSKFVQLLIPKRFERTYENYLRNGMVYFIIFLLFDQFLLARYTGFSFLGQIMGTAFTFLKSAVFLGT
ncbi:MAG TPA: site-2 protease family protein [Candidatus Gracilibacteria bacterium]|nr:site-2 protease family protein [Candidatus Gracilibacteria bacterium]